MNNYTPSFSIMSFDVLLRISTCMESPVPLTWMALRKASFKMRCRLNRSENRSSSEATMGPLRKERPDNNVKENTTRRDISARLVTSLYASRNLFENPSPTPDLCRKCFSTGEETKMV